MLDCIQDVLLIILILFQFVVMAYLLYTTHKRYKADSQFWKQQEEISEEFLKQLKEQAAVCLDEGVAACEQENTDKKINDQVLYSLKKKSKEKIKI